MLILLILLQAFVPAVYDASENEAISLNIYLCPFDTTSEGADDVKLLAAPKMNLHHIFPQSMKDWFGKRGIDVDQYNVELTQGIHLKEVHGKGGFVGLDIVPYK